MMYLCPLDPVSMWKLNKFPEGQQRLQEIKNCIRKERARQRQIIAIVKSLKSAGIAFSIGIGVVLLAAQK